MRGVIKEALKKRNIAFREDVSTAMLSTFRIGGNAALLIDPCCTGELIEAVLLCESCCLPYVVIGKGSNILFGDQEIETVLIRTTGLDAVKCFSDGRVHALCGVSLIHLASLAAREGLRGLCFAAGIPGTVGGAVFMNAGTHVGDMSGIVECVEVLFPKTGEIKLLFNQELNFSYRKSRFQAESIILLGVTLKLTPRADPAELLREMREINDARRTTQPLRFPSAGSVFKKPSSDVAVSRIVDELGLKGKRIGGAEVSRKHAGFIVNVGGATSRDVHALIEYIQNTVEREKGFKPIPEVRFIPEK